MLNALLGFLSLFCLIASLLPMVSLAHGIIRVFDFPRLQIAALSAALVLYFYFFPGWEWSRFFAATAFLALLVQSIYIIRFTPLWPKQTKSLTDIKSENPAIRLFVCNVKQGNRDYGLLRKELEKADPDIALFMETDQDWTDALEQSLENLPHRLSCPQDNSYGMLLASKMPFRASEIKFLLTKNVPSFHSEIILPDNRHFKLITLHPEPPLPYYDTVGRDAEVALAAEIARNEKLPVIVTGDLNDVAWSRTTRRFLRLSELLDPRQGRGMYNTFDARYPFIRWPLDHIFHSPGFELVSMKRLPFVGSDHFPMLYDFVLAGDKSNSSFNKAAPQDHEEAKTLVKHEQSRDRNPVGEDWEN